MNFEELKDDVFFEKVKHLIDEKIMFTKIQSVYAILARLDDETMTLDKAIGIIFPPHFYDDTTRKEVAEKLRDYYEYLDKKTQKKAEYNYDEYIQWSYQDVFPDFDPENESIDEYLACNGLD